LFAQALFNPNELVDLGNPFTSAARAGLDVARSSRHSQIGYERVFRFAGPVRQKQR
jgi:hypothetical protein